MCKPTASTLRPISALTGLLVLAACAPATVPVHQAERSCMVEIDRSYAPRSQVNLGVSAGSYGVRPHAGIRVDMSSDRLLNRDPAEVYARCVVRRSGQMPTLSYYDRLGIGS